MAVGDSDESLGLSEKTMYGRKSIQSIAVSQIMMAQERKNNRRARYDEDQPETGYSAGFSLASSLIDGTRKKLSDWLAE